MLRAIVVVASIVPSILGMHSDMHNKIQWNYGQNSGLNRPSKLKVFNSLGKGQFSEVYRALLSEKHEFAVKVISKDYYTRLGMWDLLYEEIKAMRLLKDHDHILNVHQVLSDKSSVYLMLDYVEQGELCSYVENFHPLPMKLVQKMTLGLVKGLMAIHSNGLIHRDIKPENILVENDGSVKIADFGLVSSKPQSDAVAGSPLYYAPEMIEVENTRCGSFNQKVDIWAMGLVFYIMTMCKCAFDFKGLSKTQYFQKVLNEDWNREDLKRYISEKKLLADSKFFYLIDKMLKKDPIFRPTSTEILDEDLFKLEVDEDFVLPHSNSSVGDSQSEQYQVINIVQSNDHIDKTLRQL